LSPEEPDHDDHGAESALSAPVGADATNDRAGSANGEEDDVRRPGDDGGEVGAAEDAGGEVRATDDDAGGVDSIADGDGADAGVAFSEIGVVKSVTAVLPRTEMPATGLGRESDEQVAVDAADATFPLTQRALSATSKAAQKPRALNFLPVVTVRKILIVNTTTARLLPCKWHSDEAINGKVTLMQQRYDQTVAANS